uniref:Integrin alpha-2 domain-containing protein n=1 Tax=Oncorhynchus mykiss TaxID=8022 RepID=A0A8C7VC27_ONCMY
MIHRNVHFSILIGAPKANTSQTNIIEGGSVYLCPWSQDQSDCSVVNFDNEGDRSFHVNDVDVQVEFKSHQWFGATVRSHGNTVLACAPRYYWRTEHDAPFSDATGTCYLSVDNLKTFVEYAPCRTERHGPAGQGYCQGGFSADFTKVRQLVSATTEEIVKAYFPSYFLLSVTGQIQTRQANSVCSNVFQMGSYFGYAVAATDINNDGLDDLVVGAPMFMQRGSDGLRWEEVGRVYVYLQQRPLLFEPSLPPLGGSQAFGRFGSSLAPLGDLNQDGFNDIAIGCPFGGDDQQGLVLIYNGHASGLKDTPTQALAGQWASGTFPASFGYALRGEKDLDQNGYPDLIVGAFGADKAVLYRYVLSPELDWLIVLNEGEFRDKLSPIYITLNFSLDPLAQLDLHGLKPILNYQTTHIIKQKAQIQLDCGEDNICVPDLKLAVYGDRTEVYLGDENSLTLTFNARNEGEGGAYEAELYVVLPAEADYSGIARNNALTCSYEAENQTRSLVCDLGNPMKSGTSLWAGLRFTVPRLKDTHNTVQFELQIRSKNENKSQSDDELFHLEVAVVADVILQGVSRPDKLLFPPPNWRMSHSLQEEQDVGPEIQHVYELVNNGPSMISQSVLELRCPLKSQGHDLLYPLEVITQGPLDCSSNHTLNALKLKVRDRLTHIHTKGPAYIILPQALIPDTVLTPVMWNKPDSQYMVPLWIIILAILAGLLLLTLVIYVLYKLGFFKRSNLYGTAMEKAQLKPQASSEA